MALRVTVEPSRVASRGWSAIARAKDMQMVSEKEKNPIPLTVTLIQRQQCRAPAFSRSITTEASAPSLSPVPSPSVLDTHLTTTLPRRQPLLPAQVLATVYKFPSLEPSRFVYYTGDQLQMPLRRDLLQRAVLYEADCTRQGTASTKTRSEIRGSSRKIRPQKGSGKARLGEKNSPMLRGGAVAHGPRPRDFSTELPRKIYDLAWRTALSYRYKQGELLLIEDSLDFPNMRQAPAEQLSRMIETLRLGSADRGSMFVLAHRVAVFNELGSAVKLKTEQDVDVKDLLSKGKVLIQKSVLDRLLAAHSSDLYRTAPKAVYYD